MSSLQPARNWRASGAALALCLVCSFATPGRADSAGSSYAFANRVVFDTIEVDRVTSRSTRLLNVVPLDDKGPLKVAGKAAMPGQSAYIAAYGSRKDELIVLLWDRIEIYDLADAAKPRFMRGLLLSDQGVSTPGQPLVETAGADEFLLLGTRNTTRLTAAAGGDWRAEAAPPPTPEQKARMAAPPDAVLAHQKPTATPLLLRQSERYRYELAWSDRRQPGRVVHRKYLRQVDKASGRAASELLLGSDIETID
jgi:hypothetical protein